MHIFRNFGAPKNTATTVFQDARIGQMNFAFIDMGQGDCTFISCPDNTLYIIDCGSSARLPDDSFEEAKKLVRAWAKGNSVNIIMTHPDKDHYNQFINLLTYDEPDPVSVDTIYFSLAASDTSPLGRYNTPLMGSNIERFGEPDLVEVTLNYLSHFKKTWTSDAGYTTPPVVANIPATGYVIDSGEEDMFGAWSITIIAGNVPSLVQTESQIKNTVSLCTVVKFGGDTLFMTGDSTLDTLNYLYANQRAHFQNVSIFQVPHHGSESSPPSNAFKNWTNPQTLLVSVGEQEDSNNLPKKSILDSWLTCSRLREANWAYDCWTAGVRGYNDWQDILNLLNVTWKNYRWRCNKDKPETSSFFWLKDTADAERSGSGFYGITTEGYFLYRLQTKKDLYLTGIQGTSLDHNFEDEI